MEPWESRLRAGDADAAWDAFVSRYRRLIFAAIRHFTTDHDEVMDVFAHVCGALRADDLTRLRRYLAQPDHRARFSTWLVTVVRNLTVDWFRRRDGRPRLSAIAASLSPIQQAVFTHVFVDGRSHLETFELLRTGPAPDLSFKGFLGELRATYRAVAARRTGPFMAELAPPLPEFADETPAEDVPAHAERQAVLAAALDTLAADERLAVQLFVLEDMPADQVAAALGWPNPKTVYNRVYRALAAVRARLERAGIRQGDL